MSDRPDCRTCGACCWSIQDQPSFCYLTEEEYLHFSPQFRAKNVELFSTFDRIIIPGMPTAALRTRWKRMKSGPFKGLELCVCCQLDGSMMSRVSCHIYKRRPGVCKYAVEPGDKTCRYLRRAVLAYLKE